MDLTDIGVFRLAERRLAWVDQRQRVLAQNVANANTPGYRARDMAPFSTTLESAAAPSIARTDPAHLTGSVAAASSIRSKPHARTPDGNTVSMEEQLGKVADTSSTQELVTNLYRKYHGLFRTALGRNG